MGSSRVMFVIIDFTNTVWYLSYYNEWILLYRLNLKYIWIFNFCGKCIFCYTWPAGGAKLEDFPRAPNTVAPTLQECGVEKNRNGQKNAQKI